MSIQEVCRLCLSKDNLVWVFDKRLERTDHMKDVILITTGVEIHSKDVISQKICTKCGQDAIKMFQFRQKSLKNDRYLKAQCRDLLKRTDLKIPNTDVTIKTERMDKEEIQESPCQPAYKVHPTMRALSRRYPQMQFPSICLLFNVDPCISMEMDTVENYFKSRNLNMRKYVQVAMRASDNPKKSPTVTKSSEKITEYSAKNGITDHVAQSTSAATVDNAEIVHKVSPINIKLNQSGYSIVRPSTENINHGKVKHICESTISCEQLTRYSPESQSGIKESKKRRLSDNDLLSEPQIKKVPNANHSNMTPVQPSVEKISIPVFKCNICSSVQFSAKHLKKHQIRHSRCKFCKIQFKSVGMKQQHIIHSCLVKEALNSMSNVYVERVEFNRRVRLHYQDAFSTFPPLPGMEKMDTTSKSTTAAEEIIEIISDDEDTSVSTENSSAPTMSAVTTTFHKNSTPTVIRPEVRMKNDNVLDSIKAQDSDLGIIEELLTKIGKLRSVTEATQTELPTTELIEVNEEKFTAELKNLKQVLYSYQVPVKIQKGSINASYNYQSLPPMPKKLALWNDLTPIDFESENNLSNQISSREHVITETPATDSSNVTNTVDLIHKSRSSHFFNNDQTPLQNIGIATQASSSDSPQSKSPVISTQTESLSSTLERFALVQESPTISTQTSFNRKIQNGDELPDSRLSKPTSLELFPVQAASSVVDIPIRRPSPNSFGTDQITPRSNSHLLEIFPVPVTSPIATDVNRRNSSGADQITSQSSAYINSGSFRKSPVQNKSDVNANCILNTQSEAMNCSVITTQDLTNKAIEYVFNNCGERVETGAINVRPSNGVIYSNNNQPRVSQSCTPKGKIGQRHPEFSKGQETVNNHNINFPLITNSSIGSHVFIKPPPPYPRGSTPVNQKSQSYILSRANSSNVPYTDKTLRTNGYYNAYNQYIAHREEFRSPMVRTAGTYRPKSVCDSVAQSGKIGYFPASNVIRKLTENRSNFIENRSLPSPKVTEPSISFAHYSKVNNYVNATSVIVSPVNQNCEVSSKQLPITCTNSPTLAACDTLTYSVPSSDNRNNHFTSGLIRVRNVCELK